MNTDLSGKSLLVVGAGGFIGGFIARAMFRKHFEKAGLV